MVDLVITDLGVFTIDKKGGGGMSLIELADGLSVDEIKAKTEADFRVALVQTQAAETGPDGHTGGRRMSGRNLEAEGAVEIEVRQASHPKAVRCFTADELRRHFLIERLFEPDKIMLTYSHIDRLVAGGAMPVGAPLLLGSPKAIGSPNFLDRRELGVVNLGGAGRVVADGHVYELAQRDALYVAVGTRSVRFESLKHGSPAKFYLVSTPAHCRYETVQIAIDRARRIDLGEATSANVRTIYQLIHPDVCRSCQLVLGMTQLQPGNLWNTMPCHTHDRRSEVYMYFDLARDARVFHFMGEPTDTKHLVVANEQAILSPGWSIHSGVGTSYYAFVWAMGGDNQDFNDMDMVPMEALR